MNSIEATNNFKRFKKKLNAKSEQPGSLLKAMQDKGLPKQTPMMLKKKKHIKIEKKEAKGKVKEAKKGMKRFKKPFSMAKAKSILKENKPTLKGKPITKNQRGMLGAIAGGDKKKVAKCSM